ncbi:conserved hypothetical protein [Gammaproteobacteria bacterium]
MKKSHVILRPNEVLSYIRETAEILRTLGQEVDRRFLESSAEMDRRFQETDRKFQETDRKFQDTDRKFQETDRKFQDTDRKFQETDAKIKQVNVQIGNLGNRLGEFVEEMVLPSALRVLQGRGIEVHAIYPRARAKRKTGGTEIDLLLINTTDAVAIEVKSALGIDHVNEHLERMDRFKVLFPHHAHLNVHGAVAGMVVPEEVAAYAVKCGLFVLVPAADTMQLFNTPEFQPKTW